MKIHVLVILLGLLHVIYAVPTLTGPIIQQETLTTWDGQKRSVSGYESQPSYMAVLQNLLKGYIQQEDEQPSENFKKEIQKYIDEHGGGISVQQVELDSDNEIEDQEVEGEPSESFKEEIQEYFNEQVEVESSDALSQGDTVAFQSFTRNQWLSCFRDQCDVGRCPGMYFMQRDWTNCRGAVFRIYRMKGPGYVTVGDFIGIRYPREDRQWLGCTADMCAKSGCPGKPTDKNGFASEEHWLRCTGEVFRIYAMGKKEDEIINSGDDIMLYYLQGNTWLSLGDENVVKATCPGISRPPGQNRYDECATEVFRIVKRD